MGWRVKPACGLASAAAAPLSMLATVLLPAPAPPTTATWIGVTGCSLRNGPTQLRASAAARRNFPVWTACPDCMRQCCSSQPRSSASCVVKARLPWGSIRIGSEIGTRPPAVGRAAEAILPQTAAARNAGSAPQAKRVEGDGDGLAEHQLFDDDAG